MQQLKTAELIKSSAVGFHQAIKAQLGLPDGLPNIQLLKNLSEV